MSPLSLAWVDRGRLSCCVSTFSCLTLLCPFLISQMGAVEELSGVKKVSGRGVQCVCVGGSDVRHRKHWRSPEACVAVSLFSLFLDLRMLTGTGCFPWKPSQSGMDVELLAFELLPSQSLFSQGTSVPVKAPLTLQKSPSLPRFPPGLSCYVKLLEGSRELGSKCL